MMKGLKTRWLLAAVVLLGLASLAAVDAVDPVPMGLPTVPIPADNPQTPEKIALGEKLFHDTRFSSTGEVSCATCHDKDKVFTDSPLRVSEGIEKLTGTRNAPTVVNSAYMTTMFWDGRSPSLEDQALHPFLNPVEMALEDHEPILEIVRTDPTYVRAFRRVFGRRDDDVTMAEVTQAIAAFERTQVSADSPFDRYYFGGDDDALTPAQKRGLDLFDIQEDVPELATEFVLAEATASEVDEKVLTDERTSELGRLVVTRSFDDIGAFKTPTLRKVAVTAPYMHDGRLATLVDVVIHYNNGGVNEEGDPVNDFLSGGIRPLDLTDDEIDDLVAFMEALTSPEFADLLDSPQGGGNRE